MNTIIIINIIMIIIIDASTLSRINLSMPSIILIINTITIMNMFSNFKRAR